MKTPAPAIKVIIATSSFLPEIGGLQQELKWFLDNLDKRLDEQPDIEAYFAYPTAASEPYARFQNIMPIDMLANRAKAFPPLRRARHLIRTAAMLRVVEPDVVHCQGVLPEGMRVLAASSLFNAPTKIIATSHGYDIAVEPALHYEGHRRSLHGRLFARMTTNQLAAHAVVSRDMVKYALESGSPRDRVVVVPNGIPLDGERDFDVDDMLNGVAGIPDIPRPRDGINILSLSGPSRRKNVDALIDAFAMAKPKLGDSKLLLAREGPAADRIVQLVKSKGLEEQTRFIGAVKGRVKQAYFRASDVYCLPSTTETFGVVLLEAMKFEAAILASDRGALPELVKDGVNGLLAPPDDIPAMADALIRLRGDARLRKRLTDGGLRTVKDYSISRVVDEYVALYKLVAGSEQ